MRTNKKLSLFFIITCICISSLFPNNSKTTATHPPRAIIIGATSGIGEALAFELVKKGYVVGLTGRREQKLNELKDELGDAAHIKALDVAQPEQARFKIHELIDEMGSCDLMIINAAVGYQSLEWEKEKQTADVNVTGFLAMANLATDYFLKQGHGHLVGISSVLALRGSHHAPAYAASKAFVSHYLDGLRNHLKNMGSSIVVTDIKPGLVDTPMVKDTKGKFWVASCQEAASQIVHAIKNKTEHAYVTKKWRLVAWAMKILPEFIWRRT